MEIICVFLKDKYSNFCLISCSLYLILELFPLDLICGQLFQFANVIELSRLFPREVLIFGYEEWIEK